MSVETIESEMPLLILQIQNSVSRNFILKVIWKKKKKKLHHRLLKNNVSDKRRWDKTANICKQP